MQCDSNKSADRRDRLGLDKLSFSRGSANRLAPATALVALGTWALLPSPGQGDPSAEGSPSESVDRWHDPVSEQGQRATGLYLGAAFVHHATPEQVIRALRNARMDAAVLDLKDSVGRIHHDTAVAELQAFKTGWLGDVPELIRQLHAAGMYTIARISCFADRRLPERYPDRAIQDNRPARARRGPWKSWGTGGHWLDPYNPENHQLVVALAREAQALGFDEIQLDYVRFPVDDGIRFARYPSETEETKTQVLMRLLREVDEAIRIPIGVDVFGLAAYRHGDPSGLGQDLVAWTRHVEVYTPMLYVNSMRAWRVGEPNRAYRLVREGIRRLRQRVGPRPVIRPFLQAFRQGADSFDIDFIIDQIRASQRGGADGFLFWHPGHSYGLVRNAMRTARVRRMTPFTIPSGQLSARQQLAR